MHVTHFLTPALEDYLEVIHHLSEENGRAKISDIARRMDIAKPSVTQAITALRNEGMVYQERYGPVYLTAKGEKKAREVWHRHQVIRQFLREALQVNPTTADRDACLMEHSISAETFSRMEKWLQLQEEAPGKKRPIEKALVPLSELLPGQKARLVKIVGKESWLRQRLLEMGLVPGVKLELERVAPLGDPIEILLKGFHLSLRREEASMLLVKVFEREID